jgi:hypothetical protein
MPVDELEERGVGRHEGRVSLAKRQRIRNGRDDKWKPETMGGEVQRTGVDNKAARDPDDGRDHERDKAEPGQEVS